MYRIDPARLIETSIILLAALAATIARVTHGVIAKKDYRPADPALSALWVQRMRWAIAGEVAATVLFVLLAEAIVMWKGLPGPVGVIIGAAAALLGFPFVAGIIRKRVAEHFAERTDG